MVEKEKDIGITVKKSEDMSEWYNQAVLKAQLADFSAVKGCMIIRPYGYAIWQRIMDYFNERLKGLGVQNAYFPLFIPESFFKKEAEHAEGFKPEVAWIANREEERLAVRPTSETVMYDSYSNWVRSWRDLPLRISQWANVVRWETKMTKLFLRTREFLWQEGHCVYSSSEECDKETRLYLEEYKNLCENLLAIPVLTGRKTEKEKFAGAVYTLTIEAFMPDGKALQMGTSHNLGQHFAKAFGISYLDKDEKRKVPYQNSWGFSTRTIGAVVMVHGDDKGLVLPPKIAPVEVVIVPIIFEKQKSKIVGEAKKLKERLKEFRVELDDRDEYSAGWKFNEWELKGVPLRVEIGPKDIEKNQAVLVRRDSGQKTEVKISQINDKIKKTLDEIQKALFKKAKKFLDDGIVEVKNWNEFVKVIRDKKIAKSLFCGDIGCEDWIKDKTQGANSRFIEETKTKGNCVHCNKKANYVAYFSKSY